LAHARCAPEGRSRRARPRRPGLRRRGERAGRGVLLPRAAVQPGPAPLVLRHGPSPRDGGIRGAVSPRPAPPEECRVGRRRGVLPDAPERGELLALLVVGESRPRWRRRTPLLRGVPAPRDRRVTRGLAAAAALTLAVVTTLVVQAGGDPASALRHVYLLPVVALALAFGGLGGALVVRDGEREVVAAAERVVAGSVADRVLAAGATVFVPDTGDGSRPRRVFATPLVVAGQPIGVLAVERIGELGGEERAAVEALGAHVAVALENARLTSRARRFAEELERQVANATRHLEELDRAKSVFVVVASHELRTPVRALHGLSELLAVRWLAHEEVRRKAGG